MQGSSFGFLHCEITYMKLKAHIAKLCLPLSSLYVYFCKHCTASEVICVHCTYGSHQGLKLLILISRKETGN